MALTKERVESIVKEFQRNDKDTGSPEVQVALLTNNVEALTAHLSTNKKDFSARKGLLKMVARRKRLLSYLNKEDHMAYTEIIKKLALKR